MRFSSILQAVVVSAVLVSLSGCYSSNPEDIRVFTKPAETIVNVDKYILMPPDEIEVHCSKVPEIHMQRQQIRPDGMVAFEAVGELVAAGKTPKELADSIHARIVHLYALQGENPVEVRVTDYAGRLYYVLGQVHFPGPRPITGRDTVMTALAYAQPTPLAWDKRIQVIRPSVDPDTDEPRIFEINLKDMVVRGDQSKDVLLEEHDIIYVPPTILGSIGMKIEELVRPIARAFSTVNIVQGPPGRRY
jgi:polysaccharide export outer membrane protein